MTGEQDKISVVLRLGLTYDPKWEPFIPGKITSISDWLDKGILDVELRIWRHTCFHRVTGDALRDPSTKPYFAVKYRRLDRLDFIQLVVLSEDYNHYHYAVSVLPKGYDPPPLTTGDRDFFKTSISKWIDNEVGI